MSETPSPEPALDQPFVLSTLERTAVDHIAAERKALDRKIGEIVGEVLRKRIPPGGDVSQFVLKALDLERGIFQVVRKVDPIRSVEEATEVEAASA